VMCGVHMGVRTRRGRLPFCDSETHRSPTRMRNYVVFVGRSLGRGVTSRNQTHPDTVDDRDAEMCSNGDRPPFRAVVSTVCLWLPRTPYALHPLMLCAFSNSLES
jgi:hypothetical protein